MRTSLIQSLDVLGDRRKEAFMILAAKGFSTITTPQSIFIENMLRMLKQHHTRLKQQMVIDVLNELHETTTPQFFTVARGGRVDITWISATVDIATPANMKLRWVGGDGRYVTVTTTTVDVNNGTTSVADFPFYHGGFYKLHLIYEDVTAGDYVVNTVYVLVKESTSTASTLLPAPTFGGSVPDGSNKTTALSWTNPSHRDWKYTQLRTSGGLLLYRGTGTTYTHYYYKTGNQTLRLYSEGPNGQLVISSTKIHLSSMVIADQIITGGTNLLALATTLRSVEPIITQNITFSKNEGIFKAFVYGTANVITEGDDCGDALAYSNCAYDIVYNDYAEASALCNTFKIEIFDLEGKLIYWFTDFVAIDKLVLMLIPSTQLTWVKLTEQYCYKIWGTDINGSVQLLREGLLYQEGCDCTVAPQAPNQHIWLTNAQMEACTPTVVAATSGDCGCGN